MNVKLGGEVWFDFTCQLKQRKPVYGPLIRMLTAIVFTSIQWAVINSV